MRISAIIPCYNYAHYLGRAIESALAQTHPLAEVLVVDDGSTDNTAEVARAYPPPVRHIFQENRGLSSARNTGVKEARSEWVALLDADDWWLPLKTERQVEALGRRPEAVLSYTGVHFVEPNGTTHERRGTPDNKLWPTIRHTNQIVPSTVLIKRDVLLAAGGFDESLRACEDWEMWVRLGPEAQFAGVEEPLTEYQLTPMSMSSNEAKMLENTERILEKTLVRGLTGWDRILWRRRIRGMELYRAYKTVLAAGKPGAKRYLLRSLIQWPSPGLNPQRFWQVFSPASRYRR